MPTEHQTWNECNHCFYDPEENDLYVQCRLKKGNNEQMAWIPFLLAREGNHIKIKDGENWDDGWEVYSKYGTTTKRVLNITQEAQTNLKKVLLGHKNRKIKNDF